MTRRELLSLPLVAAAAGAATKPRLDIPSRQIRLDSLASGFNAQAWVRGLAGLANGVIVNASLLNAVVPSCNNAGLPVSYSYSLNSSSLCLNSPFFDHVLRENRDILAKYPVHGAVFEDLIVPPDCACQWCVAERKRTGLTDISSLVARRVENALADLVPGTVTFTGRPLNAMRDERDSFTHFEIHQDFQHNVRYLRTLGKDCLGLAAGERDALRIVASGAKVCMTRPLFTRLLELERWTEGTRAVADIGVLSGTPVLTQILVELHQQFNVVDAQSDFALYKLIITAKDAPIPPRLTQYISRGGPLLVWNLQKAAPELNEQINGLLVRPSVIAPNLPSTAEVTMLEQRTQGNLRRIVHVLTPAPLDDIRLSVSLPQHPLGVVLVPSEQPLEFKHNEFYTTFTLPRIDGHQAIAFE